jgi:hypothetical protein
MPDTINCKHCERRHICKVADSLLAELSMATLTLDKFSILDAQEAAALLHFIMDKIAEQAGDRAAHSGFGPEPPAEVMELLRALKVVIGRRPAATTTATEEVPDATIH